MRVLQWGPILGKIYSPLTTEFLALVWRSKLILVAAADCALHWADVMGEGVG